MVNLLLCPPCDANFIKILNDFDHGKGKVCQKTAIFQHGFSSFGKGLPLLL